MQHDSDKVDKKKLSQSETRDIADSNQNMGLLKT